MKRGLFRTSTPKKPATTSLTIDIEKQIAKYVSEECRNYTEACDLVDVLVMANAEILVPKGLGMTRDNIIAQWNSSTHKYLDGICSSDDKEDNVARGATTIPEVDDVYAKKIVAKCTNSRDQNMALHQITSYFNKRGIKASEAEIFSRYIKTTKNTQFRRSCDVPKTPKTSRTSYRISTPNEPTPEIDMKRFKKSEGTEGNIMKIEMPSLRMHFDISKAAQKRSEPFDSDQLPLPIFRSPERQTFFLLPDKEYSDFVLKYSMKYLIQIHSGSVTRNFEDFVGDSSIMAIVFRNDHDDAKNFADEFGKRLYKAEMIFDAVDRKDFGNGFKKEDYLWRWDIDETSPMKPIKTMDTVESQLTSPRPFPNSPDESMAAVQPSIDSTLPSDTISSSLEFTGGQKSGTSLSSGDTNTRNEEEQPMLTPNNTSPRTTASSVSPIKGVEKLQSGTKFTTDVNHEQDGFAGPNVTAHLIFTHAMEASNYRKLFQIVHEILEKQYGKGKRRHNNEASIKTFFKDKILNNIEQWKSTLQLHDVDTEPLLELIRSVKKTSKSDPHSSND